MSEERALLEAFVVDNENLERLEALLARFNIFEALGVARQELRHSDFLAFLLDPRQDHGLGDAFLKRLLKRVLVSADDPPMSAVEIDVANLRGATVRREWQNIDVLVLDTHNRLVCAIENKIGTGEHSGQLGRYRRVVAREFPGYRAILVFLTSDGTPPSDSAYIPFSYTDIAALVDAMHQASLPGLQPEVAALMTHYATMLRRYIVSDSETADLCRKIYQKHQRALDLIFEHRPDLQTDLVEIIKELVAGGSPTLGLALDDSLKSYIRFTVTDWDQFPGQRTGRGWTTSGRVLLFVFNNFSSGLSLGLHIGPGPEPVRQAIWTSAEQNPQVFNKRKPGGKWWLIYERAFLQRQDYTEPDPEKLQAKLCRAWKEFLSDDLPAIHSVIAQVEWPRLTGSEGV